MLWQELALGTIDHTLTSFKVGIMAYLRPFVTLPLANIPQEFSGALERRGLGQTSCEKLEYYLIVASLMFAFFYWVLRALVLDYFVWIIVIPWLSYLYILGTGSRFSRFGLNRLDKIVCLYVMNGLILTLVGSLFAPERISAGAAFIHFYLPAILYFISRKYTSLDIGNLITVIRLVWILAVILIIDILIEYYIVEKMVSPRLIPWVRLEIDRIPDMTEALYYNLRFHNVRSILSGHFVTGMVVGSMLCFIVPFMVFLSRKDRAQLQCLFHRWQGHRRVNEIILLGLMISSLLILNKTTIAGILLVLIAYLVLLRSKKLIMFLSVLLVVAWVVFSEVIIDSIWNIFIEEFVFRGKQQTAFAYIMNFDSLIDSYRNINMIDMFFGLYLTSGWDAGLGGAFFSELRILLLPGKFGIGWTLIVFIGIGTIMQYCLRLFKAKDDQRPVRMLGIMFFGFFAIYVLDVHYPTFMRHGPLELFFVMAGGLSSLNEFRLKAARGEMKVSIASESGVALRV